MDVFYEEWVSRILADPMTKQSKQIDDFVNIENVIDARVHLKNTYGYQAWSDGQVVWEEGVCHPGRVEQFRNEIDGDRPTYEHFKMKGYVLDVGGWIGLIREFLPSDVKFISIDPFIQSIYRIPEARKAVYQCLSRPLNFIGAMAEFLPFKDGTFDWVHMRSMLDHLQVPDLALLEANRVLKKNGSLLIGMSVEGGRSGTKPIVQRVKESLKMSLDFVGIDRFGDHHMQHPTYESLVKMIEDAGLIIEDIYWQPKYVDQVVYIRARKG